MTPSAARARPSLHRQILVWGSSGALLAVTGLAVLLGLSARIRGQLSSATDAFVEEQLIADRISQAVMRQFLVVSSVRASGVRAPQAFRASGDVVYDQLRLYLFRDLTSAERLQLETIKEEHERLEVAEARAMDLFVRGDVETGNEAFQVMSSHGFALLDALNAFLRMREGAVRNLRSAQEETFRTMSAVGGAFGVVLLVGSGALLRFLLRRVDAPLSALSATARRIEQGELEARVPEPRDGEFATVAASFNKMAVALGQALEEARRNEERFRHLFSGNPLPMWVYDLETLHFLEVNDAAVAHYGYTRDEFFGMRLTDIRPPEDVPRLLEDVVRVRSELSHSGEWRHRLKDGRIIDVDITSHLLEFGGRKAALVVAQDITEPRRVQRLLRERERSLSSIYDTVGDMIFHLTVEDGPVYRFTSVNRAFRTVTGLDPDQVVGKRADEVIPERSRAMVLEKYGTAIRGKRIVRWEETSTYPTGTLTGEVSVAPVFDDAGRCTHLVGAVHDITRRKQVEEDLRALNLELEQRVADRTAALRESEERFRTLASTAHDAIVTADADGLITYFNPGAERTFGYASADVLGRSLTVLMPEQFHELHRQGLARFLATGEGRVIGRTVELVGRRKDGAEFPLELSLASRRQDGAPTFIGIIRDISRRKETEQALRHYAADLEAANQELEAFNYSVSHDLRAPLRSIHGFSQAVLEDYRERLDPDGVDLLGRVCAAAERMGVLIDDLLELSRASRAEIQRDRVDLSGLAERIAAELAAADPERRVEFRIAGGLTCEGDQRLLEVVLQNLMGNAWKFTGKRDRAVIEVGMTDGATRAYFVRDNGAGFDMTYADKLFDPFQRLHQARDFAGSGVGLALVQRIIRRHGGRVWAEGLVDRGATFYFTLPVA